jgi:hypothetical protein
MYPPDSVNAPNSYVHASVNSNSSYVFPIPVTCNISTEKSYALKATSIRPIPLPGNEFTPRNTYLLSYSVITESDHHGSASSSAVSSAGPPDATFVSAASRAIGANRKTRFSSAAWTKILKKFRAICLSSFNPVSLPFLPNNNQECFSCRISCSEPVLQRRHGYGLSAVPLLREWHVSPMLLI